MFCGNCGKKLNDAADFCTSCGQKIDKDETALPSSNDSPFLEEKPTQQNDSPNSYQVPNQAVPVQSNSPKSTSSNKGLIIGLSIGIGALAMAIVALILFLVFGGRFSSHNLDKFKNSNINAQDINMSIIQIDTSKFPDVLVYASVKDSSGNNVSSLNSDDFQIVEYDNDNQELICDVKSIDSLGNSDELNVNLVLDESSSMNSANKMTQAKNAATNFVNEALSKNTNNIELTTFDDNVYNKQPFTNNQSLLQSSISSIKTKGSTALYDALYWAIQRTSLRTGSRFVVAFTDGEENNSKYTESEVVELSKKTGIPVYIIGIGDSINRTSLQGLASKCKGQYYDCSVNNMSSTLSNIYSSIYKYTESLYKFAFTSQDDSNQSSFRTVSIVCKDGSRYSGECQTTYMPKNDVSLYENKAVNGDYVLPESNSRYYTEAELQAMSIWDLYLARNEIYARHGRDFKHRDLKEYFATKTWYSVKYSPEEFDRQETSKFNDFERKNADLMLKIEKSRNSPYLAP